MGKWAGQRGGWQLESRVCDGGLERHLCQVELDLAARQLKMLSRSLGKFKVVKVA